MYTATIIYILHVYVYLDLCNFVYIYEIKEYHIKIKIYKNRKKIINIYTNIHKKMEKKQIINNLKKL